MKTGTAHREGAKASKDSSRDNWRTPKWLMDVLHDEFDILWDATARMREGWAHGCTHGNLAWDSLKIDWPTNVPLFFNPPFSQMKEWAPAIAAHPGPTVTVCKLAPSTKWWQTLTWETRSNAGVAAPRWLSSFDHKTIAIVGISPGVSLWLIPQRVAYEPPPGIKATSPSFETCVVVRR
jgi:hypothetical protein